MKIISIHVPEAYLNGIDRLVSELVYPSRAELIRVAIRDLCDLLVFICLKL